MMKECFPISVLNAIKAVPEVCSIYCATANPTTVIVAEMAECRGVIGVMDGKVPVGVEDAEGEQERKEIARKFGYKI